jgi:hypothetical protein
MRHLTTVQQKLLSRWQDLKYRNGGHIMRSAHDLEDEQMNMLRQISNFNNLSNQVTRFLSDRAMGDLTRFNNWGQN